MSIEPAGASSAEVAAAIARTATPALNLTPGIPPVGRAYGVVVSIQTGPPPTLTLTLGGSQKPSAGIRYMASYSPTVGDTVVLDHVGTDLVVRGALAVSSVPWISLVLTAPWAAFAGYSTPAYRIVGDRVQLKGALTGGVSGTAAFTLPAGARPLASCDLAGSGWNGTPVASMVDILATGSTAIFYTGASPLSGANRISLDGLSFSVN